MAKAFTRPTYRVITIVDLLAEAAPRGLTLGQICTTLEMNRSTCSRILKTMAHAGYLTQPSDSYHWVLGPIFTALPAKIQSAGDALQAGPCNTLSAVPSPAGARETHTRTPRGNCAQSAR